MFVKGHNKTGGRTKGGKKARLTVRELCEKEGVDVLKIVLRELDELSPKDRIKTCMGLMPYLYPQQRATEVSGTIEHQLSQPLVQITLPSNGRESKPIGELNTSNTVHVLPSKT